MEYISVLLTILTIHILVVISPGPDFIMAVKNSLTYGRKAGMRTAVGFGGGIAVHVTYCALGLALIISKSILLFSIIKWLGALYLARIGIQALLSKGGGKLSVEGYQQSGNTIGWKKALQQGFLTNVLNPKATLFFLGLFTVVISPATPTRVLIIASIFMVINTTLWFCLVSIFLTNPVIRNKFQRRSVVINKVLGGALLALGVKIAVTE